MVECLGGDVTVLVVLPFWEVATATLVFLFAIQGTGLWIDVGDDVRLASDRTESMVVESEEEIVEEAEREVNADEVATAKTGDGGDEEEVEPLTTRCCLGPSGMPKAEATGARMPVIARSGAGGGCVRARVARWGLRGNEPHLEKAGMSVLPESR